MVLFITLTLAEHALGTMAAIDPSSLPVVSDLARRLHRHVEFLAAPELRGRKPGTPGHRKAAEYIMAQFAEIGLESLPSLHGYGQPVSPDLGDNLIGLRRAGMESAAPRWILLGAHYDHLGGPYLGADDNASAVAILLETARRLPALRHHPVLFVAFNTEEAPYLRTGKMGSRHFVSHLPPEIGSPSAFHAIIVMDLMGGVHWGPLAQTIFAAGAEKSPGLYRQVMEAASSPALSVRAASAGPRLSVRPVGLHLVEEIPLVGQTPFSDYDAFRNAGVPFVFLSAGRTPRYHRPTDLPGTLHYERMAATVEWLAHLLQALDDDPGPYGFEDRRIEWADEVETFRPLVAQAADEATAIPGTSRLSLWKLRQDDRWLRTVNITHPTSDDIKRLERLSIRMQCLLADFPGCFLF